MAYSPQAPGNSTTNTAIQNTDQVDKGLRAYVLQVFNWMTCSLLLSGISAYLVASQPALRDLFYSISANSGAGKIEMTTLAWVVLLAPLGMVLYLGVRVERMSSKSALAMLWAISVCMGLSLAPIAEIYTGASITRTFLVTAGTFSLASFYGYTTGADLTRFGNMLFVALIGLLVLSVSNLFVQSSTADLLLSAAGVLIFTGFASYDTQRMKLEYAERARLNDHAMAQKSAVLDALAMYLNFMNLFLNLLRFLGVPLLNGDDG